MTRPDYMVDLDALHVISIDRNHNVRPDSRLMLNVFRAVAGEEDFQDKVRDFLRKAAPMLALTLYFAPLQLDNVRDRVDAIESLHRTRELTVKTGEGDLGGFLRLRIGDLLEKHEKREDEEESSENPPESGGKIETADDQDDEPRRLV